MDTRRLRHLLNHHGAVGVLVVSLYLLARSLATRRRAALLAVGFSGFVVLLSVLLFASRSGEQVRAPTVLISDRPALDFPLYTRQATGAPRTPTIQSAPERLLGVGAYAEASPQVKCLAQQWQQALQRGERTRALSLGHQLVAQLPAPPTFSSSDKDGKWGVRAGLGELYLEYAWPDAAIEEFEAVLRAVPAGPLGSGHSAARQSAAYGLARAKAVEGAYDEALAWLKRAPAECYSFCGNGNERQALWDYPLQRTWTVARLPFDQAEAQLLVMMAGGFTPRAGYFNGDTSEEQKEHAAVEAAVMLGLLYLRRGEGDRARIVLEKAGQAPPLWAGDYEGYDACRLAQGLLRQMN